MRELEVLGPFDACVCLYTVLGYFDDEDNERVIRAVHDALRPGGRLALDVSNPLAHDRGWPGVRWRECAHGIARESGRYDAVSGRLVSERTLFRKDGTREDLPVSVVRLYVPSEMARLLSGAGLEVEQLYGALADEPFQWDRSPKQVWIARRP